MTFINFCVRYCIQSKIYKEKYIKKYIKTYIYTFSLILNLIVIETIRKKCAGTLEDCKSFCIVKNVSPWFHCNNKEDNKAITVVFKPTIMTLFGVVLLILIAQYPNVQKYYIDNECKESVVYPNTMLFQLSYNVLASIYISDIFIFLHLLYVLSFLDRLPIDIKFLFI